MTTSATTVHQQLYNALVDDPILRMLGFDHRSIGSERTSDGPELLLSWSSEWYGSAESFLGTVTIEPVGVDEQTRIAVLDRVERALTELPRGGSVARVRRPGRHAPTTFQVLARPKISNLEPSGADTRVGR